MRRCLGLLTVELLIHDSRSLKDRRAVVKSLKDRVRGKFNVSVLESSSETAWQRADLGFACLGETEPVVEETLRSVVRLMDEETRCEAMRPRIEYYA